ncbi:MAG: hypothetical protein IPG43_05350 [Proteobacteria bacterium]|nr:hypothetical protein [Pseudomonadota bacterium]
MKREDYRVVRLGVGDDPGTRSPNQVARGAVIRVRVGNSTSAAIVKADGMAKG